LSKREVEIEEGRQEMEISREAALKRKKAQYS
jgi:hypothetical protein